MTQRNVTHRIRLRKPWQRDDHTVQSDDENALAADKEAPVTTSHRVDVPDREPIVSDGDPTVAREVRRVIYRRQFHRPSGIESGERVLLEVGAARGHLVGVRLNSHTISGTSDTVDRFSPERQLLGCFRIDERMAKHNELEIELESMSDATAPPRLIGEVNLLIAGCE